MSGKTSAQVRAGLDHPVVDVDGHFVEVAPVLHESIVATLEELGGAELRDRYLTGPVRPTDTSSILAGRTLRGVEDTWSAMPSWWGWPVENVRDRATAHLPGLLYERLDELGIDFAVLYPSMVLSFLEMADGELSAALCRATNRHHADAFSAYADRMTPGAIVPMHTPDLAIQELRAAHELGFKAVVIAAYARRPVQALEPVYRLDHFGLDSPYDYDPFWAECVKLGIAPAVHSSVQYHDLSRSTSSYVYNHMDGISKCHEALCKSLLLGGVFARFPDLRVGFLEGGVAWGSMLYTSFLGHWEKRRGGEIEKLDPSRLDVDALMQLVVAHGDEGVQRNLDAIRSWFSASGARPEQLDEFAATGISSAEDLKAQFDRSIFMGCEADDPLIPWAFAESINPCGARLHAMFGSDISHWDVVDMAEPVEESWEHVEHGRMTERDFRDFVFANGVALHAGADPSFFRGTVVEAAVEAELA